MRLKNLVGSGASVALLLGASFAGAAVVRVPSEFVTIQDAVDAAQPGDEVRVGPGDYCGATITKPVTLRGFGRPTIVGCEDGPRFTTGARLGFFLPGTAGMNPASGTQISGFSFDGRGVSNDDLAPIAFGIFARFAHDVHVANNRFFGTVQAVTNTGGDRWFVWHNRISELTLFGCPGLCTGGDGIVLQTPSPALAAPGGPSAPANRPEQNVVIGNTIEGAVPDGFDRFGMVGILVFNADRTLVSHNRIAIPDNPAADAPAHGVVVTNTCCGETPTLPGSRNTVITFNDARRTEVGFLIEGSGGANTQGLVLLHNRGSVAIEPPVPAPAFARGSPITAPALSKQRYF
jgi:hypothetical protein